MIRERTTESPSAIPWDCCYVSEGSNFRRAPHFCLECDCVAQLIHTRFCCSHPGHILEHSEDDTKSLFAIIKVHRPRLRHSFFYSCPGCYYSVGPLQKKKKKRSHGAPFLCLSVWLQIISDLMFFRGTHKKEFESRWKSFTLVKKSMENRVGSKIKNWKKKAKKRNKAGDCCRFWWVSSRVIFQACHLSSCSFMGKSSTSERCSLTGFCSSMRLV